MTKSSILFVFCCLVWLMPMHVNAQNTDLKIDSLAKKMELYGTKNASSVLFVHVDKTVYVANESVWFTAYLLNYNKQVNNPSVLSTLLVNEADKSIVTQLQFVMNSGVGFGHMLIPDSIPAGNYSLVVYTNELLKNKPIDQFIQRITIKATSKPQVAVSLSLADSVKPVVNGIELVHLRATGQNSVPIPGAVVNYHLGGAKQPFFSGTAKTDKNGLVTLAVPAGKVAPGDNVLTTSVKYNKEVNNVELRIPVTEDKLDVKFYPEGGNLVCFTESTVGWETKNIYGAPVAATGVLLRDGKPIDTIYTDGYGLGKFKLIPFAGSTYRLKIAGNKKDTTYQLPAALSRGPVISLKNAVANDSLRFRLTSRNVGRYSILIHNYRKIFYSLSVEVNAGGRPLLVNLADVPKGLYTITILDSLQRPCAERLFFAHFNEQASLNLSIDKSAYVPRQKVNMTLKLNPPTGSKANAVVSIACVQTNRIEPKKANDILSYCYLNRDLGKTALGERYLRLEGTDKPYLEYALLIKGWTRYNWQDMEQHAASDTLNKPTLVDAFDGTVTRDNSKPLKKPANLMLRTDSATKIVTTDASGHFLLNDEELITAEGKKIYAIMGSQSGDAVTITNPFTLLNTGLSADLKPENYLAPLTTTATTGALILADKHNINLKEVVIKATKRNDMGYLHGTAHWGANECGDYVCRYGILNCPNHPFESDNTQPVVGGVYPSRSGRIVYQGCSGLMRDIEKSTASFTGINFSKEYYGSDYSQISPSQPDYVSTIYWKHLCVLNSDKEVDLSFYTSDITGQFKIIVQGVADNGLIYKEKAFEVKK